MRGFLFIRRDNTGAGVPFYKESIIYPQSPIRIVKAHNFWLKGSSEGLQAPDLDLHWADGWRVWVVKFRGFSFWACRLWVFGAYRGLRLGFVSFGA